MKIVSNLFNFQNVDLSWCKKMETGLPQPDAVFYLDVSEEEASKRRDYGRERYENKGNQLKVAEIYQTFSCEKYWKVGEQHIFHKKN